MGTAWRMAILSAGYYGGFMSAFEQATIYVFNLVHLPLELMAINIQIVLFVVLILLRMDKYFDLPFFIGNFLSKLGPVTFILCGVNLFLFRKPIPQMLLDYVAALYFAPIQSVKLYHTTTLMIGCSLALFIEIWAWRKYVIDQKINVPLERTIRLAVFIPLGYLLSGLVFVAEVLRIIPSAI